VILSQGKPKSVKGKGVPSRALKVLKQRKPKGRPTGANYFYKSLDWISLWEDFYLTLDENALYKWKTVFQFARHHGKTMEQRRFLMYFLGPDNYDQDLYDKYFFCKPQDWQRKRETGGWYNDESIKQAAKIVRSQNDAFGVIQEAGREVTLPVLIKVSRLSEEIDKAFEHRPFLDPSKPENIARAKQYFDLQDRAFDLYERYTDLFAKQHGINFQDFESFQQVTPTQLKVREQSDNKDESYRQMLGRKIQEIAGQVQSDYVEKAVYDLPIPETEQKAIAAVEVDLPRKKKVH
jgi:hypothetical protein